MLSGHLQYPVLLRYSFASFLASCAWLLIVALRHVPLLRMRASALVTFAVLGVGALWLGWDPAALQRRIVAEPAAYADCVSGLRSGLADYWRAKPLVYLTNYRVTALAITPDGDQRYEVAGNRTWATRTADNEGHFEPTFILLKGLNEQTILARFGTPDERRACADSELWLYDTPLPVPPANAGT